MSIHSRRGVSVASQTAGVSEKILVLEHSDFASVGSTSERCEVTPVRGFRFGIDVSLVLPDGLEKIVEWASSVKKVQLILEDVTVNGSLGISELIQNFIGINHFTIDNGFEPVNKQTLSTDGSTWNIFRNDLFGRHPVA